MPTLVRPDFKAKITKPCAKGNAYVFFVAKINHTEYKVSVGLRVTAKDWRPEGGGKGNGRCKASSTAANDRLDRFEALLLQVWEKYPSVPPERFRQLVREGMPAEDCLPIGAWLELYLMDEQAAMRRLPEIGKRQLEVLSAFVKRSGQPNSPVRSLLVHGGARMKTLFEYLREFVEGQGGRGWYGAFEKHLTAFAKLDGGFSFEDVDWKLHERFLVFLYAEQPPMLIKVGGEEIRYRKPAHERNTVVNQMAMFARVMREAAEKEKLHQNEIYTMEGFVPSSVDGNGCPLYIEDMMLLDAADFSGDPVMEETRKIAFRGFFTAVRHSDLGKLPTSCPGGVIELVPEKTREKGIRVAIPVLPILEKYLSGQVIVPHRSTLNPRLRAMLKKAGIDRPLTFTTHKGGKRQAYQTSLTEQFSVHDLRRSAATMLIYDTKVDRFRVKMITGHTTDQSFEKYLFPSKEQLSAESLTKEWREKREAFLMGA